LSATEANPNRNDHQCGNEDERRQTGKPDPRPDAGPDGHAEPNPSVTPRTRKRNQGFDGGHTPANGRQEFIV
jgi:hypothetical protein